MTTNIVIVDDLDPNVAGSLTYWRLSGNTDYHKLVAALSTDAVTYGSVLPPPQTSPEKALRRAVQEHVTPRGRLMRAMASNVHGWELYEEEGVDGERLTHKLLFSATFENWVKVNGPETYRQKVEAAFAANLDIITHGDVSSWLVRCAYRASALAMRDSGGIYFIPRPQVPLWRAVRGALKAAGTGHEVFTIPAMKTEDTIDAVVDSLKAEAAAELAALDEELQAQDIGAKALRGRAEKCSRLTMKIGQYEKLLGKQQAELTARIEDMRGQLVAAAMLLEEQEEAA